ncbi:protein DJ-1-like isoform X2 [Zootermopsis nevadensis]|uniref:protein DJ-1-like isoform X2 n=1 Tax=Zootermopsis nevadensis TaxID=136037 RepID=UPI000B8EE772|nr:protein DJ-1-like isoform X2 [Zootermopsis nevadensis]
MVSLRCSINKLFVEFHHCAVRSYSSKFFSTCKMTTKSALVLLAEEAEEMELISVTVAGLAGSEPVKCSRGVVVCPDSSLKDAVDNAPFDVIVLPGGLGGARNLAASSEVGLLLQEQEKAGRLVAAICAAPTALLAHNVGIGKSLTSYPIFKEKLQEKYFYKEDNVVVDDNLVTSRGPATAFDFALAIADILLGAGTSKPVAKALLKV